MGSAACPQPGAGRAPRSPRLPQLHDAAAVVGAEGDAHVPVIIALPPVQALRAHREKDTHGKCAIAGGGVGGCGAARLWPSAGQLQGESSASSPPRCGEGDKGKGRRGSRRRTFLSSMARRRKRRSQLESGVAFMAGRERRCRAPRSRHSPGAGWVTARRRPSSRPRPRPRAVAHLRPPGREGTVLLPRRGSRPPSVILRYSPLDVAHRGLPHCRGNLSRGSEVRLPRARLGTGLLQSASPLPPPHGGSPRLVSDRMERGPVGL